MKRILRSGAALAICGAALFAALAGCRAHTADCNRFDAGCEALVYAGLFPACVAGQYQTFLGSTGQPELLRGLESVSDGTLMLLNADGPFGGNRVGRPYSGDKDIAVVKLGFQGDLQWVSFLGSALADGTDSSPIAAVELPAGYLIALATSDNWGAPLVSHGSPGSLQISLALLSRSGELLWNTFLPQAATFTGRMVRLFPKDGGGAIGIATVDSPLLSNAGQAENSVFGNVDLAVIEFNTAGEAIRHRYIGGTGGENVLLGAAARLRDGGYVALAVAQGAMDATFSNQLSAFDGNDDPLVVWLDSAGRYRAHGYYGSIGEDFVFGGADTPHGLVIGGTSKDQYAAALNSHSNVNGTNDDGFAALISPQTGELAWVRYLGTAANETKEGIISAAVTQNGNLAFFGSASAFGAPRRTGGGGVNDFLAAQLSPTGAVLSLDFFGGSGEDQGIAVVRNCEGGMIYGGASEAPFGSGPRGAHNNDGFFDGVLVKSSSDLSLSPLLD